jgi:hypothetical protein
MTQFLRQNGSLAAHDKENIPQLNPEEKEKEKEKLSGSREALYLWSIY